MFCDFGLWQDPRTNRQYGLRSHCVSLPTIPKYTLRISKYHLSFGVDFQHIISGYWKKGILEKNLLLRIMTWGVLRYWIGSLKRSVTGIFLLSPKRPDWLWGPLRRLF
jgi:hypothetical protein